MNDTLSREIKAVGEMLKHPRSTVLMLHYNMVQFPKNLARVRSEYKTSKGDLNTIGLLNNTDKANICYNSNELWPRLGHDYLRHYMVCFSTLPDSAINILEFGCARGDSLRTWEEYFPKATIYGVDLDPDSKSLETERTHILVANAVSEDTFNQLRNNQYHIIIDDASHAWGEQRWTLEHYWELLAPGGYFIVEDLECGALGAYAPDYTPELIDSVPFFDYAVNIAKVLRWPANFDREKQELTEQYSQKVVTIRKELDMMLLISGAIIMRKKETESK